MRQFERVLEKEWVIQDGCFRIFCSLLGMSLMDVWKVYKDYLPKSSSDKHITVKTFSKIVALSYLNNTYSNKSPYDKHIFDQFREDDPLNITV